MQIDIRSILEEKNSKLEIHAAQPLHFDEVKFAGPAELNFTLTGSGAEIVAHGTVKGSIFLSCAKCLTEFSFPLRLEMTEVFVPLSRALPQTAEASRLEEQSIFTFGADHRLDLSEPIRQNLILNLPMHPLCRPDCKGLCPACGSNLNEGNCAHPRELNPITNDIWAPLAALQKPGPGQKKRRKSRA